MASRRDRCCRAGAGPRVGAVRAGPDRGRGLRIGDDGCRANRRGVDQKALGACYQNDIRAAVVNRCPRSFNSLDG